MECHAAPGISNLFRLTHNGRTYTIMTYKSRLFGLTCIKYTKPTSQLPHYSSLLVIPLPVSFLSLANQEQTVGHLRVATRLQLTKV